MPGASHYICRLVPGKTQKTSRHDLKLLARMAGASHYIFRLVPGKTQKTSKQDIEQDVKHQFKESIIFILWWLPCESYFTADDSFKR